jgi:hypothetical protein
MGRLELGCPLPSSNQSVHYIVKARENSYPNNVKYILPPQNGISHDLTIENGAGTPGDTPKIDAWIMHPLILMEGSGAVMSEAPGLFHHIQQRWLRCWNLRQMTESTMTATP